MSPPGAGMRDGARAGPQPLEADRAVALRAGGDELGEEARLERRKLGRQGGEPLDLPRVVGRQRARERGVAERGRGQLLAEEEADAAERPLPVEGEVAVADEAPDPVLERRRGAHDPVRERGAAQRQRLPERLEIRPGAHVANVSHLRPVRR